MFSINGLAKQKYRFDLGQSFLTIVNFTFIIIAASDKLTSLVNLPAKILVLILVPSSLFLVWLFGLILDKTKFAQAYQEEQNRHNKMLRALHLATRPTNEKK